MNFPNGPRTFQLKKNVVLSINTRETYDNILETYIFNFMPELVLRPFNDAFSTTQVSQNREVG
jgi:hypothetical protein